MPKSDVYPVINLIKTVIFPSTVVPLIVEGQEMVDIINNAIQRDHLVVLTFTQRNKRGSTAVLARIIQFWYLTPQVMGATIEGLRRVKVFRQFKEGEIDKAEILDMVVENSASAETEALARNVFHQFNRLMRLQGVLSAETTRILKDEHLPPYKLSDIIASALNIDFNDKIRLLEMINTEERLKILNEKIAKELSIAQAEQKIQKKVNEEINKVQKEYVLRERLRAIEKELGILDEDKNYSSFETKIKQAQMSPEVEKRTLKELQRLRHMPAGNPEASYISTYLEILADLPWTKRSQSTIDLSKANSVLDHDHYGLEKVKERIIEYLAIQKLTGGKSQGSILCFVGPPGTGKTSVGRSIARALDRKFARISLGGIHDESEIRGHRRTYVGAMPGRIIQGIRSVGTKNPVFMLDEIDKVGTDFRGDPSAALLEVLDPAQNNSFSDNYLEVPFDLSEVFFITTANVTDTIPLALRDRMEVIEFTGYTNEEKLHIAKKFLLPKVIQASGLNDFKLRINNDTLMEITTKYTREAGVRELERKIAQIARRIARKLVEEGKKEKSVEVKPENLPEYLGAETFQATVREQEDEVGIATGLAWTPIGGEIIFIEVSVVPGKHSLTLTGQLGNVMKESAQAALTFIRSKSRELAIDPHFFEHSDIHIHVPAGAVPKDGASAGIAITTALASALTQRKVRKEVALTGEITLRGRVLPVGGIKEKTVAAYRAGAEIIVMPKANEQGIIDVPDEVRKKIKFILIDDATEALKTALI